MGCPLFELIEMPIKEKIGSLPGIKSVSVELTFDPPWNPDKMSKEGKVKLGFF
jgi:metal-sulfur cluster biosynthetic enzyme